MKRAMKANGLLVALLLLVAAAVPAGAATVTERIEKTFPMKASGAVSIENVNGNISVQSWDKGEVQIVAVKTVKATSEEAAKKDLQALKVTFRTEGEKLFVETEYPKSSFWDFNWFGGGSSKDVAYTVMAPAGVTFELSSVNGAVAADVKESAVSAETVNGSVEVSGAKLLEATTVNGKVVFDVEAVGAVETTNGSVEGTVRSTKPAAGSVETVNGSVRLRFTPAAAMHLDLENVNGSIDADFSGLSGSKHCKGGEVNGGGAKFCVATVNGSIEISKL